MDINKLNRGLLTNTYVCKGGKISTVVNPKKNAVLSLLYWIRLVRFSGRKSVINKLLLWYCLHSIVECCCTFHFSQFPVSQFRLKGRSLPHWEHGHDSSFTYWGEFTLIFSWSILLLVHKDSHWNCHTLNIPSVMDCNVGNKRIMTSFSRLPARSEQEGEVDYTEKRPCLKH